MFTFVSSATGTPGINGGPTSTFDSTGATIILVNAAWFSASVTVNDNKGNTYVPLTDFSIANIAKHRIYVCLAPTVGTGHTVSVTGSSIYPAIHAVAFSATTPSFTSQENGAISSTSPLVTGNITPPVNNCLLFTGICENTLVTNTIPSGFTGLSVLPFTSGVNMQGDCAYYIQPTAAVINPSWSWTGALSSAAVAVGAWQESSAAVLGYSQSYLIG